MGSDRGELRALDLPIGALGWGALVEEAAIRGTGEAELIAAACVQLAGEEGGDDLALEVPDIPGADGMPLEGAETHRVSVLLSPARWRELEAEAALGGITLEGLVRHAMLAYVARLH